MPIQIKPCAHAGDDKQKQHEPGIEEIQDGVLILNRCEGPDDTAGYYAIEHIQHMVDDNSDDGHPSDVVNVGFSHIYDHSFPLRYKAQNSMKLNCH